MNNLHICLNEFTNASRVLKQANSLVHSGVAGSIGIAALYVEGLKKKQEYAPNIICTRFELTSRGWGKGFLSQIFKYFEFCWRVYRFYKREHIKMVNIHTLGLLPFGVFLKWAFEAKLVYDTHELETERNGLRGIKKRVAKFVEKRLIKYVDITFVVSENIADWYAEEYQINRPIVVLNTPRYRDLTSTNHFREKLSISNQQVILLYQGALTNGRGIDILLEAFKGRTNNDLVIVFMGYGGLENKIKQAALENKNIYFFPAVHPDVVLEYTSSADLGVSFIENVCLSYYYCMPNKLFEYAMAGLPILVSNMKDMSELVIKNNMGEVAYDYSVQGINDSLERFLQGDLSLMKQNAYRTAKDNSWEIQEVKMLSAYSQILNR